MQWCAERAVRLTVLTAALLLAGTAPAAAQSAPRTGTAPWAPPAALEARVQQAVAARWGVEPARVRLEWGAVRGDAAPAPDAAFELIGSGAAGSWVVAFQGVTAAPALRVRLRAGAEVREPRAARDLERETTLADGDIAWTPAVRWGAPETEAPAVAAGWIARRRIATGEPLREPAVGPPLAVRAGELVQAAWSRGGISLTLPARAQGSGALGQRVALRTEGGKRLEGVVTGPAQVLIDVAPEGNR
jgi:flagella basal body P-ring formation protein FlgA